MRSERAVVRNTAESGPGQPADIVRKRAAFGRVGEAERSSVQFAAPAESWSVLL